MRSSCMAKSAFFATPEELHSLTPQRPPPCLFGRECSRPYSGTEALKTTSRDELPLLGKGRNSVPVVARCIGTAFASHHCRHFQTWITGNSRRPRSRTH